MNAPALLPRDRDLIVNCLNLWQRPGTEGERTAAAAALNRLLESRGFSWDQLIREPAHEPEQRQDDWRSDLLACQRAAHRLTPWEQNFVASVATQQTLSVKQAAVLARIVAKVRGWTP